MFLRDPLVTAPLWINQRLVPLVVSGMENSALRGRFSCAPSMGALLEVVAGGATVARR